MVLFLCGLKSDLQYKLMYKSNTFNDIGKTIINVNSNNAIGFKNSWTLTEDSLMPAPSLMHPKNKPLFKGNQIFVWTDVIS
jgi:hypothetical protein